MNAIIEYDNWNPYCILKAHFVKGFTSDRLQVIFISVFCRLNWNSLYFLGYKKSNYHVDYVIFTYESAQIYQSTVNDKSYKCT